jgi:hypothetical protein
MKLCTLFLFVIICFPIPRSAQSEDSHHYSVNPRPGGAQSARARGHHRKDTDALGQDG